VTIPAKQGAAVEDSVVGERRAVAEGGFSAAVPGMGRSEVVGREAELALVMDFVAAAERGPQALVLDGEAGIGKTTLFETALAEGRRRGFGVFSCRPVGAETAFSFAALAELLAPSLPDGLAPLPLPQRRALSAALLLEEVRGPPPDEHAIAAATLPWSRKAVRMAGGSAPGLIVSAKPIRLA
jgi:hypothetical protein